MTQTTSSHDKDVRQRVRSRRIALVILTALVILGAVVIARRVVPMVTKTATTSGPPHAAVIQGMPEGVMDGPPAQARAMVKSVDAPVRVSGADGVQDDAVTVSDTDAEMERKIIRRADIEVVVEDLDTFREELTHIAQRYNGYIATLWLAAVDSRRPHLTVDVVVESERFNDALRDVRSSAVTVKSERVSANDATRRYVDMNATLRNLHAEEEAFATLLERASAAGEWTDVISIMRELSRVRGEIERTTAQFKALNNRIETAEISIVAMQQLRAVPTENSWRPGDVIRSSFHDLIVRAQGMANAALRFLTLFVPLFLLWIIVIAVVWRVTRPMRTWLFRVVRKVAERTHR